MRTVGKLLEHGQNLPPPCKQESCQRHLELGLFVCLGQLKEINESLFERSSKGTCCC